MTTSLPSEPADEPSATGPATGSDPVGGPPVATDSVPPKPRGSRGGKILLAVVMLFTIAGVAGSRITVPYVIFSPGDATPIDDYLRISGTRTYHHRGDFLLLTVRVSSGRPNVWRFVQASLDDDSKVIGEQKYLGTTPRGKVNQLDVQAMSESQHAATTAALTRLGYDVKVTGTGALVARVLPDTPAAHAGLEAGDVITAIDGVPVQLSEEVGTTIQSHPIGTAFELTVRRDGTARSVPIVSGTAPSGEIKGKPFLGISSATEHYRVHYPFEVKIDAGDVSGPSGGLAFALSIMDQLTPGDLSGGQKVAVTGEIDSQGHVGEVGGVPQKAVAAREAGAKLMIVPRSEVHDARSRAGSMPVVGVRTLDDALRVLRAHGGAALPPKSA